ncbi:MAG: aminoacyl-tRNA hydrolase [Mogibacterium sp.]|nr:aminoacyl-tRNA hydrolase [Mogibacterium sp.]
MGFFRRRNANKNVYKVGEAKDSFVIIGLGNPGEEYVKTRHNMGYRALDILAENVCIDVRKSKFHSLIGQGKMAGKKVVLVKPLTYMNKSGIAARETAMYFDVPSENVIVIYDDVDLPLGSIRIRKAGGAGTHNGMKSVVSELGTKEFARIRIGVGAASGDEELVDRVIGKVPKEEQPILDKTAAAAAAAAEDIVRLGIEKAMSRHNRVGEV